MNWSPYLDDIRVSSRRVLTMLNKNSFEKSSGSFDRSFWHFKTRDYPSSIYQMGIGILAKLWKLEGSEYFKNEILIEWIVSGIDFLERIQKSDGSFDEWYVNERGWGGPTGYLMNSCLDVFEIVGDILPTHSKECLTKIIEKGISFLIKSTEGHMLANHVAIVILPLIQAKHLLKMNLDVHIEYFINEFKKQWIAEEGWSVEYDGADPGYQSGTLSFLSKCLKYEKNEVLKDICIKSLSFISYFVYPSGSVGGAIGSRHTVTYFPAGIEFFRDHPIGARLSMFFEENIKDKKIVLASDLDDHYLFYRLFEFLDAHEMYISKSKADSVEQLPYEKSDFDEMFTKAQIRVGKTNNSYYVISYRRSGVVRVENIVSKSVSLLDNGIFLESSGKIYSSLWQDVSVRSGDKIIGYLVNVTPKLFTPVKQIVFRIIMLLFGFHHKSALLLKDYIRKLLIFNGGSKEFPFSRIIEVSNNKITIKTELENNRYSRVKIGGEFWTRYVPQSRHDLPEHLISAQPYFVDTSSKNISTFKEIEL